MRLRRNPNGGLMAPKPGGATPSDLHCHLPDTTSTAKLKWRGAWNPKKGWALAFEEWTEAVFDWERVAGPCGPWTAAVHYGFVAEGVLS